MRIMKFVLMAAIVAAPAITFAQTPAPAAQKPSIAQRQFNQQRRISNGFRTGQLNRRQTARLERQHGSIHRQMRMMRARHNGRLTPRDRRILTHRQNVASRRVFRAEHNRRVG
jgi:Spy/CpxP family protein refolding chaperone